MARFLAYVGAVGQKWKTLVTGGAGTLALYLGDLAIRGRRFESWVWVLLGALTVSLAQFLAWRDVAKERDRAVADLEGVRTARSLSVGGLLSMNYVGTPPGNSQIQIGVQLSNYGSAILRYRVEAMTVVVGGRTRAHDPPAGSTDGTIPPNTTGDYWYPAIGPVDVGGDHLDGTVEIAVLYGHPDLGLARRASEKRTFTIYKLQGSAFINHARWTILETRDDPA